MANNRTVYELSNLSFNDPKRKLDYLFKVERSEPATFEIPNRLGEITKFYPGEHVQTICDDATAESLNYRKKEQSSHGLPLGQDGIMYFKI